jgi:hypothetical protein
MKNIDPNGDNFIFSDLDLISYEVRAEVNMVSFSINFYPIFYDLVMEAFYVRNGFKD